MSLIRLLGVCFASFSFFSAFSSLLSFASLPFSSDMQDVRRHTVEHVELRMARTAGELEEDDLADFAAAMDDDDDEPVSNDLPYNPKGLPLGWDGKVLGGVCGECICVCVCGWVCFYRVSGADVGWDGQRRWEKTTSAHTQPIPYWLYKLHGLNVKYNCEICGDQKYLGPRVRHLLVLCFQLL
jgi:hypothetical protein